MLTGSHGRNKNSIDRPYNQIYLRVAERIAPGETVRSAAMHNVKGKTAIVQQTKIAQMAIFATSLLLRLDCSFITQGLDECIDVP